MGKERGGGGGGRHRKAGQAPTWPRLDALQAEGTVWGGGARNAGRAPTWPRIGVRCTATAVVVLMLLKMQDSEIAVWQILGVKVCQCCSNLMRCSPDDNRCQMHFVQGKGQGPTWGCLVLPVYCALALLDQYSDSDAETVEEAGDPGGLEARLRPFG